MAEAFLEMQDREFEMLLKDISDGSDLFGKSMTPPVYSPKKEIEDSRHFRFSPPRTEFSEYNNWESLQIEISPPSVVFSTISMETECRYPLWCDSCASHCNENIEGGREECGYISTFQLKGTDRLEDRLKKTAERVSYQYKTTFRCGRKRSSFNEGITRIAVYDSELQDVTSLSYRLSKFEEDKIELSIRCKELHKQLLSEEKQRSRGNADYQKLETITEKLKRENDSLHKCLDLLEKHHISSVGGKPVGDLGKSQRYAKMQRR
ncbi:unnamed protein product [Mytilus edulis]|uniref:Uncharacterized protein n=1 Tax=Mytilus edulis TaxID=6550 RepID=A0A8S3U3X5_MYTED|nr:unnamed protein product [Mytilus edulis]